MTGQPTFTLVLTQDDILIINLGQQALLARLNDFGTRVNAQLLAQQARSEQSSETSPVPVAKSERS